MSTLKTDIGTPEKANLMKPLTNAYQDAAKKQKRDRLIEDHMEYVRQVCGTLCKRLPGTVDLQNLQSAGMVGLIQAAQKFDESKGINFKTYSYPRIRGAIIDEIRRNSPLTQKAMHLVGKVRTALETLEPPATTEAIAAAAKITLQEVDECLLAMQIATPQNCDEAGSVADREITPDTALEQQERIELLTAAIENLPERDRYVVQMYYNEELRLKEIGAVLNISESRVSRVLANAELQLREMIRRSENGID